MSRGTHGKERITFCSTSPCFHGVQGDACSVGIAQPRFCTDAGRVQQPVAESEALAMDSRTRRVHVVRLCTCLERGGTAEGRSTPGATVTIGRRHVWYRQVPCPRGWLTRGADPRGRSFRRSQCDQYAPP